MERRDEPKRLTKKDILYVAIFPLGFLALVALAEVGECNARLRGLETKCEIAANVSGLSCELKPIGNEGR